MLGEIRAAHRFDIDRLVDYLATRMELGTGTVQVKQFDAGQSNPTFLLQTQESQYVLRKKPPGKLLPKAHMIEREHRVMDALFSTPVPVPKMSLICEDPEIIGTPFFVMEYVKGRVFWDARFPEQSPEERTALFGAMSQTLAAVHSVDLESAGLSTYGRAGNYFERQISIWTRQYLASETEPIDSIHQLIQWLPQNIPDDDTTTLVHGDFRLDNMIFHPTQPRVIALLDWELSTLGHPLADLAYNCMGYLLDSPYHPALHKYAGGSSGIPTLDQYVAQYCAATNRDGIAHWNFYLAFSIFRSAAILQGVYKRGLQGNASSTRALKLGPLVRIGGDAAWDLVR